jgi:hypothetical protein
MGDMVTGTLVVNPDGTKSKVIGVYPQGVRDVYRVHFSDGTSTVVGEDHLWGVYMPMTNKKRPRPSLSAIDDMGLDPSLVWNLKYASRSRVMTTAAVRDKLLIARAAKKEGRTAKFPHVPITEPVRFVPSKHVRYEVDPYFLGLMLGDGHIGAESISFSSADRELGRVFMGHCSVFTVNARSGTPCLNYASRDLSVRWKLECLGLRGKRSWDKFIPKSYLFAPVEHRWSLLQGLIDTDGYVDAAGHVSYCTVSKRLADDVLALARSLGFYANVTTKEPKYTYKGEVRDGRLAYTVWMKGAHQEKAARLGRKKSWLRPPQFWPIRRIVEVEHVGKDECQCIRVSNPNGLYMTDDYIVTHNTYGGIHMLIDHCFNEPNALAVILTEVTAQSEEGGAWYKLCHEVLPVWRDAIGLEHSEPSAASSSRKPFLWIANRWGKASRVLNISLPVNSNVRDRIKGMEPSFMLIDEAQTLKSDVYFTAITQQVGRRKGIIGLQRLVYCCNPDGPSHWLYKRFFLAPFDEEKKKWNNDYARYHVPIKENLHNLPPDYYDRVIEAVKHDPIEEARMVRGEWIDRPTGQSIFAECFNFQIHVKGDANKGQGVLPLPGFVCPVGYDLGPAHSSVHFLQCLPIDGKNVWIVFDEVNTVGQRIPYTRLVPRVLARMDYWNKRYSKPFRYDHISDDSAFSQIRTDGSFDHKTVEDLSNGRIKMRPAPKGRGSIAQRTRMIMELLQSEELIVSATCIKTVNMFRFIESKRQKEYDLDGGLKPKPSQHVHVLDSLTYPIVAIRMGFGTPRLGKTDQGLVYFND